MVARTFTRSVSLDKTLATVPENGTMAQTNGTNGEKSLEAAKKAVDEFTKDEKSPLSIKNTKSKAGITFAAQDNLPKLPVPDLQGSMDRYLQALIPLQSPKEHRDTAISVKEFMRSDGPKLQEKLKEYAQGKANYIEQFCECYTTF